MSRNKWIPIWAICSTCGGPILKKQGCLKSTPNTGTRLVRFQHCEVSDCRKYAVLELSDICVSRMLAKRFEREAEWSEYDDSDSDQPPQNGFVKPKSKPKPTTFLRWIINKLRSK